MALPSRPSRNRADLLLPVDHPPSYPAEPRRSLTADRRAPVFYYLSRNGRLEHPHLMEVPLPAAGAALRLRDVLLRLNALRGSAFADAYSWSSKRCYRSGFVWCDLAEDDPIHPVNGAEYVLKGSELLGAAAAASGRRDRVEEVPGGEYRVVAVGSTDASTQTDDPPRRERRRGVSPPPPPLAEDWEASPAGKGEGKVGFYCRGRSRASALLVSVLSCGAIWVGGRGAVDGGGSNGEDGAAMAGFRRSSSCSADSMQSRKCRISKMELTNKEVVNTDIKNTSKKLGRFNLVGATLSARSPHGSKRINNVEVLNK